MSTATPTTLALAEAPVGGLFRVAQVDASCDDAARLKAMGVCVGRRLSLVKTGDPLVVCVVGSRVGISSRLAESIYVQSESCPESEVP